ncbi:MAG: methionyl-tRNA formyltransferase [Planctomycetota bacterium]|nr:MAG: methionyl-tRNA formyltransferase [Planctomycetota bacterium]
MNPTAMPLRVLFFGSASFACPSLRALCEAGHRIAAIVTQPDRPRGRSRAPQPTPLRQQAQALELDCPMFTPERLRAAEAIAEIAAAGPYDVGVVVAYGQILPQAVIELPRLGCLNVHASLLPAWRGAAPVQRAIAAGAQQTGVTIQQVVRRLDAGPVLARAPTPIGPEETAGEVLQRLAELGAALLVSTLERLASGEIRAEPQDEAAASYAPALRKEDGLIDWTLPARRICDHVRAMTPWPGAFSFVWPGSERPPASPERLAVLACRPVARSQQEASAPPGTVLRAAGDELVVAAGEGTALRLERLQPAGRRPMPAAAWLRGRDVRPGDRFGAPPA